MITNAVTLEQGVTVTQLKGQIYLVAGSCWLKGMCCRKGL